MLLLKVVLPETRILLFTTAKEVRKLLTTTLFRARQARRTLLHHPRGLCHHLLYALFLASLQLSLACRRERIPPSPVARFRPLFRSLRLQNGAHVITYLITYLCPKMEGLLHPLHHNANSDGSERTKPCLHDPISRMAPYLAAYRVVSKKGAYGSDRTFAIQRMLPGQHLRGRSGRKRSASFVEALFRWAFIDVFREATGAPVAAGDGGTPRKRRTGFYSNRHFLGIVLVP